MRRAEKKALTVDTVITAAFSLLHDNGYDGTTMDIIAEKANLARKTLYNIFSGKDEIILQLLIRLLKENDMQIENVLTQYSTGYDKLFFHLNQYSLFYKENSAVYSVQSRYDHIQAIDGVPQMIIDEYKELKKKSHDRMVRILEEGIKDGSLRNDIDCEKVMTIFSASSRAVALESYRSDQPLYECFLLLFMKSIQG